MQYQRLLDGIGYINRSTQAAVSRSINQTLTTRNWLIGAYIFEYEQNGVDRAAYGAQLLETLAQDLKQHDIKGLAISNLRNFRQFALAYPHLAHDTLLPNLPALTAISTVAEIHQTASGEFDSDPSQLVPEELETPMTLLLSFPALQTRATEDPSFPWQDISYYQRLFTNLSWSHLLELCRIDDRLKRVFYELESIKSNWSFRELKRQINNMLYERVGLSKDKEAVLALAQNGQLIESPKTIFRDPYILEFLQLAERPSYTETELENALIDHLQEFMQELGRDFCFVERQFRITVEGEHHYLDLLFYHRALQCLIAIDLKLGKFKHDYAGQMNFYLNYLKENVAYPYENPPVGILLCAERDAETVRYATAGLDNQLFVSRYLIALPSEATLKQWLREEQDRLSQMKEQS